MSESHVVIFVTVESEEQARRISDALLRKKLIACANIIKDVQSFFWWRGKVDHSEELMLIMKSREELLGEIVRLVKENHSYKVPEVVALRIVGGNPDYLRWIEESVAKEPSNAAPQGGAVARASRPRNRGQDAPDTAGKMPAVHPKGDVC